METEYLWTKEQLFNALAERHSPQVQEKLSRGSVAIAGLGGLGSNVAVSLARIGVGHLHLIDFDTVELSNLNRQQYFLEHIGMNKTEALQSILQKINPYLDITAHCVRVTAQNIPELFSRENIICEAFDNPESKAVLVNEILEHFPEKTIVAASGLAGYGSSNQIHTRRISRRFYLCGDEQTEAAFGCSLMAPRAALCAQHEANMIARLLLGEEEA